VLFFVSVGMLFDPSSLLEDTWPILATLFIIVIGKSLAAFLIVVVFRYPLATALVISASLAQIGEFSFILAGLGVGLGLMPEAGRDLVLAGALLSITLNPFVFATIGPVEKWLDRRPRLLALLTRAAAVKVTDEQLARLQGHAIIVGYGRVGSVIGQAFTAQGIPFVVIERNSRVHERFLVPAGIPAVAGDAAVPEVLTAGGIAGARLIVIASPDSFYVRRVLELALAARPGIRAVVRTHHAQERDLLLKQGASHAVMGEHELALAMSRYSLEEWGVGPEANKATRTRLRQDMSGRSS